MLEQRRVDQTWWDAAFTRQGHTGWADRLVYSYDQPIRRASIRRVVSQLHPRGLTDIDCIDVGCGTGDFAQMLHESGARVLAFDFSERVLDAARMRFDDADGRIRFVQAGATQIPAEDASADLVTSITVLQHLVTEADHQRALAELRRVLKPDGAIVLLELAPPLPEANLQADGHVIERPPAAWAKSLAAGGLRIEREGVYPQWGITALRVLARTIDRVLGHGAAPASPAPDSALPSRPGLARLLLRAGLWTVRVGLLALAWPLDHLARLPVPGRLRYYRLWILGQIDGGH